MTYRPFRYILLIVLLIFLWQSCDGDDPSVNASRLRLKLTDAASVLMRELHVEIREISVFLVDMETQAGEWVDLEFAGGTYDVLKLMNGKTAQLVDQYVPAGTELQRVRLIFGDDNHMVVITDDIETIPLRLPVELENGLVIDAEKMEMRLNTISSMIIDLNATLSVRETEDGDYFLYPVARAFPEIYGGRLRGYVAPLAASPRIEIMQDDEILLALPERESSGDPNVGMFHFIGLKSGEWEVRMIPDPESGYRDTVFTWTVEERKTADITPKPIRLKLLTDE